MPGRRPPAPGQAVAALVQFEALATATGRTANGRALLSAPRQARRGETVVATVANHIKPHRGNWTLFAEGELESLCKPCHDGEAQREDIASDRAAAPMGRGVVG